MRARFDEATISFSLLRIEISFTPRLDSRCT